MMGERQVDQAALFYEFSLERHVPLDLHGAANEPRAKRKQLGHPSRLFK
jgi:hypothetical protein